MSNALLRAGLAPLAGDEGQPLSARTYRHPGLGDRPVVRLVGERVALAEDHLLGFIGFGDPEVRPPTTRTYLGGLPYPEWALVNDPENAKAALEAGTGMKRAGKTAVTSPAKAEREFEAIARRLPPSHLPSYYEQAARLCIQSGRVFYGGKMFSRARQMETRHGLRIEDSLRREAYLEFATAGALTVKALKAYFDEVAATESVETARDVFEELAIGRTRGGNPPWKEMIRQWRRVSKTAGEDPEAATRRLVDALLDAPAIRTAPESFWTETRDAVIAVARENRDHRLTLLHLFPTSGGAVWEGILEEAGAFDELVASDQGSSWLRQYCLSMAPQGILTPRIAALVPRLVDACREPVSSQNPSGWRGRVLNIELAALCLSNGIPVARPRLDSDVRLSAWVHHGTADIAPLVADDMFRDILVRSLDKQNAGLVRNPKIRDITRLWLAKKDAAAQGGGLKPLGEALTAHWNAGSATDDEFRPGLDALDADEALARAFRAGLAEELRWPELEKAVTELDSTETSFSSSWPIMVAYTRTRAIAVGPEGRVAEHTLRLPFALRSMRDLSVVYSDDAFFVAFQDSNRERRCYWSNEPDRILTFGDYLAMHNVRNLGYALTIDGARSTPGGPQRRGDTRVPMSLDVMTDGEMTVHYANNGARYGSSGTQVAGGLPEFIRDVPQGHQAVIGRSSLAPLPEGVTETPLGHADGRVGFRVTMAPDRSLTITGVDGRTGVSPSGSSPWGIVDIPRRWRPVIVADTGTVTIRSLEGHHLSESHGNRMPAFWHFMVPSDPTASARLASIGADQVAALIDAATGLPPRAEREGPTAVDAVLDRMGFSYNRLRIRVAEMAESAAGLRRRKAEIIDPPAPAEPAPAARLDVSLLIGIAADLTGSYYRRSTNLAAVTLGLADVLVGAVPIDKLPNDINNDESLRLIRRPAVLALRAISPLYTDAERAEVLKLFGYASAGRLLDADVQFGYVYLENATRVGDLADGDFFTTLTRVRYQQNRMMYLAVGSPKFPATPSAEWPVGWAGDGRLDAFRKRAESFDAAPLDERAIEIVRRGTGLGRTAAMLLLSGLPNDSRSRELKLSEEHRKTLKVKAGEVTAAGVELGALRNGDVFEFYERVLGTDADLPFDQVRLAERVVEEWRRSFTVLPPLAAEHIAALDRFSSVNVPLVRSVLAQGATTAADVTEGAVDGVMNMLRWIYSNLPGGDPNIAGLPGALEWVRKAHTDPESGLLRSLAYLSLDSLPVELTDGEWKEEGNYRKRLDRGVFTLSSMTYRQAYANVSVRPALLGDDAISGFLRAADTRGVLAAVEWILGPAPSAIVEHALSLPDGAHAADPRVSAPDVVARVMDERGLTEDAATLYLQLLTVFNPTDKFIRRIDDWKPARHKKASAALVEAGLVVESKRARAGRSLFLHGGWIEVETPNAPYEVWKDGFHPNKGTAQFGPDKPYSELFAEVWGRVAGGDGPPS